MTRAARLRALAAAAVGSGGAVVGVELVRVRRRGSTPAAALREGYRVVSARENAVFNMFASFAATVGLARAITHALRGGARGPLRNVVVANRHIHHFVPGIVLALAAGGLSIGLRHEGADKWFAVPFGAGAALVLDESALLLELEDVYWSEEGLLSVEVTLGAAALLATLALAARLLRRGAPYVGLAPGGVAAA